MNGQNIETEHNATAAKSRASKISYIFTSSVPRSGVLQLTAVLLNEEIYLFCRIVYFENSEKLVSYFSTVQL